MQRAAAYNGNPIEYIFGDYVYKELDDGTVEITDYTGTDSTITIPSELGGKTVTNIGKYAFGYCTSLKSVTIPKSVENIYTKPFGYYYDYNDGEFVKVDGFVVKCYKGTAAETYAKDNGFKIEYIGLKHIAAKAATCTADGVQTRKCSSCGNTETQTTKNAVSRFAGANRYDTAALISKGAYSKGTDTVIIATGADFHDAMAAVPLASTYNAPLLLATDKIATKQTEAELARLNAKNVIIVSTNGAVGTAVTKALSKYKPAVISGKNYFETAANVAKACRNVRLFLRRKKLLMYAYFNNDNSSAHSRRRSSLLYSLVNQ